MRTIKKGIAAVLCAAMVITLAPAGSADAAKKPKLKKKVSVAVGNTVTIKVKNASKKAKVTWKTSKKSVAKIVKKKTVKKGKKARAVVKGVSAGKAKITAVYKLGNKKTKLKSTVTVTAESTVTPNGTPTSPVAPTNNPNATPGSTDKAPSVTDVPKTNAPKTEAPPTEEPSPKPERPTVTNDPYASEYVVPMTKANQAFAAEEATYNEDGTVDVALEPADSGHGICWYFNAEKLSVDLTDYNKLVISYNAKDEYAMAISLKEYIPDTAAESYWDGADGNKCPAIGGEQYTTFSKGDGQYEFDISSIKETAGGVFVKYNTYNAGDAASLPKAELTIKSIKLIRDPATVSTQPPATEEPGPGTSEEPGTSAEPDTSEEPGTTDEPSVTEDPYADLKVNITKENVAFADTTKAEYHDGVVDVGLSAESSGLGICFYFNDAHTSLDMSQYKSLEIELESQDAYKMAVSLRNAPASAANNYWDGADDNKCPAVGSVDYPTFSKGAQTYTLNLSSIKNEANGVFIKYNTYDIPKDDIPNTPDAEFTIKSITLVRDETVAPPTTEPTKDPEATEAPTEAPSAEPSEEPKNVPLDLNTIQITDGSTKEVQGDGSVVITCKGNYTGGITIAIPAELQEGAKKIVIEIDAEKGGEKVGSGQLKCEFDGADTVEVYNWNASSYDDTVFDVTGKKPTKLIINNQEEGIKLTIKKIEVQK